MRITPNKDAGKGAQAAAQARKALGQIEQGIATVSDKAGWEAMTAAGRWEAQRQINLLLLRVARAVILRMLTRG